VAPAVIRRNTSPTGVQTLVSTVIQKIKSPETLVRTMRTRWWKNTAGRQHRWRSGLLWLILFPWAGVRISTGFLCVNIYVWQQACRTQTCSNFDSRQIIRNLTIE